MVDIFIMFLVQHLIRVQITTFSGQYIEIYCSANLIILSEALEIFLLHFGYTKSKSRKCTLNRNKNKRAGGFRAAQRVETKKI